MMPLSVPNPPTTPRRVKVYELRNNDWFDRGTGYCTGQLLNVRNSRPRRVSAVSAIRPIVASSIPPIPPIPPIPHPRLLPRLCTCFAIQSPSPRRPPPACLKRLSLRLCSNCADPPPQDEPHIQVKSEEESDRVLLNTKIIKDDGYQKQQGEFREDDYRWLIKKVEGNYCPSRIT